MQVASLKNKDNISEIQQTILTNYSLGLLFAEIESLFAICGETPRAYYFRQYLPKGPQDNAEDIMINIKSLMNSLYCQKLLAYSKNEPEFSIPLFEDVFDEWEQMRDNLEKKQNKNHTVPIKLLKEVLDCLINDDIERVSPDLAEMIQPSIVREMILDDAFEHDPNLAAGSNAELISIEANMHCESRDIAIKMGSKATDMTFEPLMQIPVPVDAAETAEMKRLHVQQVLKNLDCCN